MSAREYGVTDAAGPRGRRVPIHDPALRSPRAVRTVPTHGWYRLSDWRPYRYGASPLWMRPVVPKNG